MNYLIDTCVVSDFFKKIPLTIEHFERLSPKQIHISTITVMEIEFGLQLHAEREKKTRPLWDNLLKWIQVVPFSPACVISAATLRSHLKTEGLPVGPYDILIAGTALASQMVIVTSNLKEFHRMPGLTIENWR